MRTNCFKAIRDNIQQNTKCRFWGEKYEKINHIIVTYWPSTQSSIKKQVHPVEDITLTGWIRCNCGAHKKHVVVKQFYNRVPQTAWVSWSWGQFVGVRGSENHIEKPSRMRKKCCYNTEELGVNMLQSVPSPTHLSNTTFSQPFATLSNKVWEVYFSKEVCSFVIIVDYVSVYSCICIMWLYSIISELA